MRDVPTQVSRALRSYKHQLSAYKYAICVVFVLALANLVSSLLFTGAAPFLSCYQANHGDVPRKAAVHCRTHSALENIRIECIQQTVAMLDELDVMYFFIGELLRSTILFGGLSSLGNEAPTIGILPRGLDVLRNTPSRLPPRYHLVVAGSKLHDSGKRDTSVVARVIDTHTDVYVDLVEFVPFVLPGDLAQTVYTRAVWSMMLVAYDWLLPTSTCALGDIAARCPNQTDHVLDYTHGPFYTFYMPEL
ncbi:Uncharacterized protein PBTT_06539 [Plasmodiophora brassicae]